MTRGVVWYLVGSLVLVALIALAGCSHYMLAEREPWRHEAELACLNSGTLKDTPGRVQITAIEGPGACGIDYPLRVSSLGTGTPMSYDDDDAPRPPGAIPNGAMPQHWPIAPQSSVQATPLPPPPGANASPMYPPPQPAYAPPQTYPARQPYPPAHVYAPQPNPASPSYSAAAGPPLELDPPDAPPTGDNDDDIGIPGGPPHPYYRGPAMPAYPPRAAQPDMSQTPPVAPVPPLGTRDETIVTAYAGPVEVQPPATLACPIVSALDQWIANAVQPAAQRWFRQPVVGIKQISAYSCRGMNGNPNAHISEHAFGNALDVAEFDLADGHKISVQYGWHGTPEEQGFLHDVQGSACGEFSTVLAPGANVYHYNHIHVDLMHHYNGRHICEPSAIPGEVAAAKARSQYAARHDGERYRDAGVTGSIRAQKRGGEAKAEDDDSLPEATPGAD